MMLTVKEMGVLCMFHDGTLSSTLDLLRHAEEEETAPPSRAADIRNVIEKLSKMKDGENVCLAFDSES